MKTTQTIILFFLLSFSMMSSLDFDLEEITLPYDNLEITNISVTYQTIICQAGNKIYQSKDEGKNWNIVFESPQNINHFYSLNPHTIFVVGDSGMVYRTMDYGDTWIDLSIDTDLNLVKIAAKDYSDCLVITGNSFIFHKEKYNSQWVALNNNNVKTGLFSVVYAEGKYFIGGKSHFVRTYKIYGGGEQDEYEFHGFTFDDNKISNYMVEKFHDRIGDSLLLYNLNDKIYSSTSYQTNTCLKSSKRVHIVKRNMIGFNFSDDRIIKPITIDSIVYVFTKNSRIYSFNIDTLATGRRLSQFNPEVTNLNISKVNDVFSQRDSLFYITSNESRIYKIRLNEKLTKVNSEMESELITQSNNILQLNPQIEEIKIYNYLGILITESNKQTVNTVTLNKGLFLISYKYMNRYYSKKILVGY